MKVSDMRMIFVSVVCLFSILPPEARVYATERPNLLVILCDDLGWGDLACFGHPHIQTPNLDRLASQGIRLTSFYSAAPVCSPSRVGLLTGRNPNRAGIYDWIPAASQTNIASKESRNLVHMRQSEVTLPRLLKQAGYATAMAGKWHCNSLFNSKQQPQPNDAGFDHWFATQNNAGPSHRNPTNFVRNGQNVGKLDGYSCQAVASEAIDWLSNNEKSNASTPFFLYIAFHEPHEPIASPPDLVAKYRTVARNDDEAEFFANVENMDASVGRLLIHLDTLGLAKNTFIVFSSDNGPETLNRYLSGNRSYGRPGPLRGMKLWTTDGGFRVAGIMRWPEKLSASQIIDEPVSSLDLLPTFCKLAGAAVPANLMLDGIDLNPLFKGNRLERTQPLFWFYYNSLNEQCAAMRDGQWKLLAKFENGQLPKLTNITESTIEQVRNAKLTDFELYDLSQDIGEATDLSQRQPDQLNMLATKMEALYRDVTSSMHVWPEKEVDLKNHNLK